MPAVAKSAPSDVVLRAASVEDAGEILTLQYAAWLHEGRLHDSFALPPLTQTLDELRDELADEAVTALVATAPSGRIVGTVRARSLDPRTWYVGRLGVVPDLQGHGLGGRLLSEVQRLAPATATRAVLTTGPRSAGNIAFYERRGFVRVEPDERVGPLFLVHLATRLGAQP